MLSPVNPGFAGYRQAGEWIEAHTPPDARVLDLKGWGLFYGRRAGYSFGEIDQAARDQNLRWVVTHDSLLLGPWYYCDFLRRLVGTRQPVRSFPEHRTSGVARVHIFDLGSDLARSEAGPSSRTRR
jgi:hypothetical protein